MDTIENKETVMGWTKGAINVSEKKYGFQRGTNSEISLDIRLIYEKLISLNVDDIITYEILNETIDKDIRNIRHILSSARKKALRENDMVFECISKVGLKRLSDAEIVNTWNDTTRRIRKIAKKGAEKLTKVDYNELSNENKIKHNTGLSIIGTMIEMTKNKKIKLVEQKVEEAQNHLSFVKTLEIFKG